MRYISTRGRLETKTSAQAILQGLAKDKGLFVPVEIPKFHKDLSYMKGMDYKEIALEVLSKYLTDYTEEELKDCIQKAYDEKFEESEIVPIANKGGAFFLELYHGKTAAFKDMALSILPHLLTKAMKKENEDKKIVILAATSGDTGKAALEGFADVDNTEIIVFFPEDGVSEIQKQQMVTQAGGNTHVFGIKGNFDDAQTGVKKIFNDNKLNEDFEKKGIKLSSANSINPGRLIPQIVYYVYAYVKLLERGEIQNGESINVAVPTGNFGNILSAYYAKHMGVPINKLICASNKNKVLTDFINTGIYDTKREFYVTNSPSMDILISSNLERLLYHLSGQNDAVIDKLMDDLEREKRYVVDDTVRQSLHSFYAGYAEEDETLSTIKDMYLEHGYLMDTHTAVGYHVYKRYLAETGDKTKTVIASTASPYKFTNSVMQAILPEARGNEFELLNKMNEITGVRIPKGLKDIDKLPVRHKKVIQKEEMKSTIEEIL